MIQNTRPTQPFKLKFTVKYCDTRWIRMDARIFVLWTPEQKPQ